jgi:hypothetical protein
LACGKKKALKSAFFVDSNMLYAIPMRLFKQKWRPLQNSSFPRKRESMPLKNQSLTEPEIPAFAGMTSFAEASKNASKGA